jgi:hypothetical protein
MRAYISRSSGESFTGRTDGSMPLINEAESGRRARVAEIDQPIGLQDPRAIDTCQ